MVLEEEKGNLVKVAVGILGNEKEQIDESILGKKDWEELTLRNLLSRER
jgi:hypothetical protein